MRRWHDHQWTSDQWDTPGGVYRYLRDFDSSPSTQRLGHSTGWMIPAWDGTAGKGQIPCVGVAAISRRVWLDFTNFGWIYVNLVVYEQQRHPRWNIYMNKRILHLQIVIFGVDTARSGAGYLFKDTLKKMQKLMKKHCIFVWFRA